MKQIGISILALMTLLPAAMACDCDTRGPFMMRGARSDLIIHARILEYTHPRDNGRPCAMRVAILETIAGSTTTNTIEIWGDNGAQCRPYVTQFPIGSEWILGLGSDNAPENPTYVISVCGAYWLKVDGDQVVGRVDSEEESQKSLKSLVENLKRAPNQGLEGTGDPRTARQSPQP